MKSGISICPVRILRNSFCIKLESKALFSSTSEHPSMLLKWTLFVGRTHSIDEYTHIDQSESSLFPFPQCYIRRILFPYNGFASSLRKQYPVYRFFVTKTHGWYNFSNFSTIGLGNKAEISSIYQWRIHYKPSSCLPNTKASWRENPLHWMNIESVSA